MKTSENIKNKLDAIAEEYLGTTPPDKHCTTWQQLQDKMVVEIIDVVEEEHVVNEMEELYYIQTGYVGNSMIWWAKDSKGYTTYFNRAGKYTKEEAINIINNRENDCAWLCAHVDNNIEAQVLTVEVTNLNTDFLITSKEI